MFGKGEGKVFLSFPAGFPVTYDCSTQYRPGVGDARRSARVLRWSCFFFSLKFTRHLNCTVQDEGCCIEVLHFRFWSFLQRKICLCSIFFGRFRGAKKRGLARAEQNFLHIFHFYAPPFSFPISPVRESGAERTEPKKKNERTRFVTNFPHLEEKKSENTKNTLSFYRA